VLEGVMILSSSNFRAWMLVGVAVCAQIAMAQTKPGAPPTGTTRTNIPTTRTPSTPDPSLQPMFISGRVLLEGGGALAEPVAIERICNGVSRREGYTISKDNSNSRWARTWASRMQRKRYQFYSGLSDQDSIQLKLRFAAVGFDRM